MPDTYVGLLGTQPSKNVNKQMEKKKSCGVSTLSPELRFISCENQSAMKTAFFSPSTITLTCWLMEPWRNKNIKK